MSPLLLLIILASNASAVGGQVYFKKAMNRADRGASTRSARLRPVLSPLMVGLGLYGLSMLFWLKTLSQIELSVAFPFLSLNFVGILIAARFHLGETLGATRLLGALLVLAGVVLVYLSV